MSSPCYTRPTAASAAREKGKTRASLDTATSPNSENYALVNFNSPFQPLDPSKPCLLSTLPPELRLEIFRYLMPEVHVDISLPPSGKPLRNRLLCPRLLHICRMLRHEVSYLFYGDTYFTGYVSCLTFRGVHEFESDLFALHKANLTRNRHLRIDIRLPVKDPIPEAGEDELWVQVWKKCRRFGNIYDRQGKKHQAHFVWFCGLAEWFLTRKAGVTPRWTYAFTIGYWRIGVYDVEEDLVDFLRDVLSCLMCKCVREAKLNKKEWGLVKSGGLEMLSDLVEDHKFLNTVYRPSRQQEEFDGLVSSLRKFLQS
ncbi:hypothetical protein BU24DRAFT_419528 [Aaosphaeria arxii CBS 175.79]|uniref:F-box domain-containing protein n=1 Tax=Aaosphaeria arxii CBS 175.79 TaxID=1450172 RepID=A0A6A5Y4G9_9PLEO|nr:uncharacterized protein BU24DRAFT_419528 [Aaosphaeria arxii CBS 175.79]KAF2019927.1 hypothetical protein BU24DRAFT_419528 [Aaosphaeria arxii CBS 175.79]